MTKDKNLRDHAPAGTTDGGEFVTPLTSEPTKKISAPLPTTATIAEATEAINTASGKKETKRAYAIAEIAIRTAIQDKFKDTADERTPVSLELEDMGDGESPYLMPFAVLDSQGEEIWNFREQGEIEGLENITPSLAGSRSQSKSLESAGSAYYFSL